ncbi:MULTISPECIES: hypothetical protein [Mesorhizobium]|nr:MULTISPECIES: hypothetical protein [Mesorhizobium]
MSAQLIGAFIENRQAAIELTKHVRGQVEAVLVAMPKYAVQAN